MKELIALYNAYAGTMPEEVEPIPHTVSARRYFRMGSEGKYLIGTYSPDTKETDAFVSFARFFRKKGIRVPELFAVSEDKLFYLQEDLGEVRMHETILKQGGPSRSEASRDIYSRVIRSLVTMQTSDAGIDYSISVPRPRFDQQAVLWDLNHFKYYFLKLSGLPFDEDQLEFGFNLLATRITEITDTGFMFRDFQSRNIMLREGEPWFIDFQGGRKGPLHYDLASLLFEARIDLDPRTRELLLEEYLDELSVVLPVDKVKFVREFYLVALIRILQALGAYGLRGTIEKKAVFLQSIPGGLANLEHVLQYCHEESVTSYFKEVLLALARQKDAYPLAPEPYDGLTVTINSFSYRNGIPDDLSGNGGGFVFDCRFLANPGKCDEYKKLTGLDPEVRKFLDEKADIKLFIDRCETQILAAIDAYRTEGYTHLMVSFGCTGGKHRSVYSAELLADRLKRTDGVKVVGYHRELDQKFTNNSVPGAFSAKRNRNGEACV
jgi:aminoglycoside/choline kinase family phosphotransferase